MPGKVNPVIPEAVSQAAMLVMAMTRPFAGVRGGKSGTESVSATGRGLPARKPGFAGRADDILRRHCIEGLEADEARCREHVENSTAAATALLPVLGYDRAGEAAQNGASKTGGAYAKS